MITSAFYITSKWTSVIALEPLVESTKFETFRDLSPITGWTGKNNTEQFFQRLPVFNHNQKAWYDWESSSRYIHPTIVIGIRLREILNWIAFGDKVKTVPGHKLTLPTWMSHFFLPCNYRMLVVLFLVFVWFGFWCFLLLSFFFPL